MRDDETAEMYAARRRNEDARSTCVLTLPASKLPWTLAVTCSGVIVINPDHPPILVIDNKITTLKI